MTSHLQIPNTPPFVRYTGNGAQTSFPYTFPIFRDADIVVSVNGDVQIGNYTVSNAGQTSGGSVIFNTAPADQAVVTLERRLPLQRISDFLEGGELSAQSLNAEFDYLTACAQQLQHDASVMLHFAKAENMPTAQLPPKNTRADKVLGFDGDGAMTVYETSDTYAAPSVTVSGSGAVSRGLDNKIKDFISVKDFGALGDGIADDRAAIQNALNAHAHVYMPPGTYRVTNTIEIAGNKTLIGAGNATIIDASANTFDTLALIGSHACIMNLKIDGGEAGLRLYGKTSPCRFNTVRNVTVQNTVTGIELDGYNNTSNPCQYNRFDHITVTDMSLHGIHLTRSGIGDYPHGNRFNDINVSSSSMTGSGVYFESARYNNALSDTDIAVPSTANACIRVGLESNKTLLTNIRTLGSGGVPNIRLDNGSAETMIVNLLSQSDGPAIYDFTNGAYTALNAGYPDKSHLNDARVTDLTVEQLRYSYDTVSFALPQTLNIDLSISTYLVNASLAVTTMALPKADSTNIGAVVTIKKTDNTNKQVIINETGGTGPDGKEMRLGSQNDVVSVLSDGSVWRILFGNLMQKNTSYVSTAGLYKPDITRRLHIVDATAGAVTVELPPANAAASIGREVTVKKTDASANNVTITVDGGVGPDNANKVISTRYHAYTVMSDGNLWHVVSRAT